MIEFGRRGRRERVEANTTRQSEAFSEERIGLYRDVARRNEEMHGLLTSREAILAFQGAGASVGDDSKRLTELEKQIAACYERSWRER